MSYSRKYLLEKAIEITKEYARSGNNSMLIHNVLKNLYDELKKINEELED